MAKRLASSLVLFGLGLPLACGGGGQSTSGGSGATLEYTFTGTGLDILGPNDRSAQLEVTVDGEVVDASASTRARDVLYQASRCAISLRAPTRFGSVS